jgi:hypothetical protein
MKAHKGMFRPTHPEKYLGNPANIIYRSGWEFRFFRYCDRTPGILKWASEEFHILYISPLDGHGHRYFPDGYLQVMGAEGTIRHFVIEIKPKQQMERPKGTRHTRKYLNEAATFRINQAKWEAAERYCKARGWTFLVLNEFHLFGAKGKPQ